MRISKNWLSDFVDVSDLTPTVFEELITTKVAEVDAIETVGEIAQNATIGRILSVENHPRKPQLKVVDVQIDSGVVRVVCGAPNVHLGALVAYVPPGGRVISQHNNPERQSFLVEKKVVEGVESVGVLVSEAELGITQDHSGIILFKEQNDSFIGKCVDSILGGSDTVLVIDNKSLTHRPDLWSHFGFARELSAILHRPLLLTPDSWADDSEEGLKLFHGIGGKKAEFQTRISAPSACRRFAALELQNVSVAQSPLWMRRRLFAVEAGVRNILVDLSNYVMLDVGQPNHAYDADRLNGKVIAARFATKGEAFLALDGSKHVLGAEDLVIADESGPVALAGIMGGAGSAVTDATTRLLLECANFDPELVRQMAKRHGLRTDASNRFEKSLSPYSVPLGIQRFVQLLKQLEPGVEVARSVSDDFPEKPGRVSIQLKYDYVRERLGADVQDEEIQGILSGLGFKLKGISDGETFVDVPYYRRTRDVSIADDLVEEVGRIYGYERVPEVPPLIESTAPMRDPLRRFEHSLRDLLAGSGFSEAYLYSFVNPSWAETLGYSLENTFKLQNPLDVNEDVLRMSLVPGMLQVLAANSRQNKQIPLFELGRAYEVLPANKAPMKERTPARERRLLCVGFSPGERETGEFVSPNMQEGSSFYGVLSLLKKALMLSGSGELTVQPLGEGKTSTNHNFSLLRSWMHPYRAGTLHWNGRVVGVLAEVRPEFVDDLRERSVVAELDLEEVLSACGTGSQFQPLNKYPDSYFEMSVVVPSRENYSELEVFLRANTEVTLLRRMEVLSVYSGAPLADGTKSISVRMSFGANDRTLSGEEISSLQSKLMLAVRQSNYTLRGGSA